MDNISKNISNVSYDATNHIPNTLQYLKWLGIHVYYHKVLINKYIHQKEKGYILLLISY